VEDRSVFELSAEPSDEVVRYGDLPDQLIERYGNKGGKKVVLIHGGYWRPEYDRVHLRPFAAALADQGFDTYLIEYRREPGNPNATVEDVFTAIKLVGESVVIGHSAGGHLALLATQLDEVKSAIALAPVSDLVSGEQLNLDDGAIQSFLGQSAESRSDLEPIRVGINEKSVTLFHGSDDIRVPVELSRDFAVKYSTVQYYELPGIGHFELIDPRHPNFENVLAAL